MSFSFSNLVEFERVSTDFDPDDKWLLSKLSSDCYPERWVLSMLDSEASVFGALQSLVIPTVQMTQMQFDFVCIRFSSSLEELNIAHNSRVESLRLLASCSYLRALNISNTSIPSTDSEYILCLSRLVCD